MDEDSVCADARGAFLLEVELVTNQVTFLFSRHRSAVCGQQFLFVLKAQLSWLFPLLLSQVYQKTLCTSVFHF